ncbi:hypothetical protein [Methanobacterium aggregans]|uniref:hypothetical protein n=1 Tax=Methanobacterium aggregans TaxID=1615586 RepID=UPI001AE4BA69|nr:hypothetical protein [Methanobacterium aggregans]MBP2046896.1 hypothetical protein [Methanobacterium aggregans]
MSVDLLLSTLLILLTITSMAALVEDRMGGVDDAKELGNARMMVENVAETVDSVYNGGNGHSTVISLPPSINGKTYSITLRSSAAFIDVGGLRGKACMVPKAISGNEFEMHPQRTYNISNVQKSENYSEIVIREV